MKAEPWFKHAPVVSMARCCLDGAVHLGEGGGAAAPLSPHPLERHWRLGLGSRG
jgi:hypothetical protein